MCLVCFGALGGVIAAGWSPKLGLDLEGGLSVVFQPAQKATPSQLQTVVGIMQARANGLGLASPNIGTQGSNIVVQLPGVKNFSTVIKEIGNTAQLFFRPVLSRGQRLHAPQSNQEDHHHYYDGAEDDHDDKGAHDHHGTEGNYHDRGVDDHDNGAQAEEDRRCVRQAAPVRRGVPLYDGHLQHIQLVEPGVGARSGAELGPDDATEPGQGVAGRAHLCVHVDPLPGTLRARPDSL